MMALGIILVWLVAAAFFVPSFSRYIHEPRNVYPEFPHIRDRAGAVALACFAALFWPFIVLVIGCIRGCRCIADYVGLDD